MWADSTVVFNVAVLLVYCFYTDEFWGLNVC